MVKLSRLRSWREGKSLFEFLETGRMSQDGTEFFGMILMDDDGRARVYGHLEGIVRRSYISKNFRIRVNILRLLRQITDFE